MKLEQKLKLQEMEKIKRKKIELVGAHRALEFYGLNEGIDNHITTKAWFLYFHITHNLCDLSITHSMCHIVLQSAWKNEPKKSKSEYVKDLDVILMIQFGVYWSDVTVDHVLEIDPKTYCIVQSHSFKWPKVTTTQSGLN